MGYVVGSAEVELVPTARGFDEKTNILLGDLSVKVRLDAETLGVREELAELTRTRDVKVKADVDESSFAIANAQLGGLTSSAGLLKGQLGIVAGIVPLLIPAAGALAAVAGGLTAMAGAATAGVGALAGVAAVAIVVDKSFRSSLKPSLDSLTGAFDKLVTANQGDLLKPIESGMRLLAQILPTLTPLIHAASGALSGLIKAVKPSTFSAWAHDMAGFVSPAITGFGKILGNVALGLGQVLKAFAPFGKHVLDGLVQMSGQFAKIGSSPEFRSFVAWAIQQVPIVGRVLGSLGSSLGSLLKGIAPIASGLVVALGGILKAISPLVSTLASGLLPVWKALEPALSAVLSIVAPLAGILSAVLAPVLKLLAIVLKPILMPLQILAELLGVVLKPVLIVLSPILNALSDALTGVMDLMTGNMPGAAKAFGNAWADITGAVDKFVKWIVPILEPTALWIIREWHLVQIGARVIWDGITAIIRGAVGVVRDVIHNVIGGISSWWNGLWSGISSFFSGIWTGIGNRARDAVGRVLGFVTGIRSKLLSFFSGAWNWLLDAGRNIVQGLLNGISGAWNGLMGWIQSAVNGIPATIRKLLGINSPSTVMAEIGSFMGQGLFDVGFLPSIEKGMQAASDLLTLRTGDLAAHASIASNVKHTVEPNAASAAGVHEQLAEMRENNALLAALLKKTAGALDIAHAVRSQSRTGGQVNL